MDCIMWNPSFGRLSLHPDISGRRNRDNTSGVRGKLTLLHLRNYQKSLLQSGSLWTATGLMDITIHYEFHSDIFFFL